MSTNFFTGSVRPEPDDPVLRSERLARGYLETEMVLREQGVVETIVVFGGTRVREPGDPAANKLSHYYSVAREFGALVGQSGIGPQDSRVTLMTGGGPGIMEAANRGASDVGAQSIGLNIRLPNEQFPNPYVSPDLCFNFHYFAIRKLHFMLRARALVIFPGGYGTMDELFETLNLRQAGKIEPLPVVLMGKAFWQRAFDAGFLFEQGVIDAEDQTLFEFAETAAEAWDMIMAWHRHAHSPLQCDEVVADG